MTFVTARLLWDLFIMYIMSCMRGSGGKLDFNERPYIAIWEVTQACDCVCALPGLCAALPLTLGTLSAFNAI